MKSIRYALLAIGVMGLGLACDVEVEDLEDYDLERAAAFSCSSIKKEREVCVNEVICSSTAHGKTTYRRLPAGSTCKAHETSIPTTTAEMACDAAAAITPDPVCPAGCSGPVTSDSGDAKCCTATKHCYDTPAADVQPVDDGAEVDQADAAPVEGE